MRDANGKLVTPLTPWEKEAVRVLLDQAGRERGERIDAVDRETDEVDRAIHRRERDRAYRRDRQKRLREQRRKERENAKHGT
jgi:hypothetical protein